MTDSSPLFTSHIDYTKDGEKTLLYSPTLHLLQPLVSGIFTETVNFLWLRENRSVQTQNSLTPWRGLSVTFSWVQTDKLMSSPTWCWSSLWSGWCPVTGCRVSSAGLPSAQTEPSDCESTAGMTSLQNGWWQCLSGENDTQYFDPLTE